MIWRKDIRRFILTPRTQDVKEFQIKALFPVSDFSPLVFFSHFLLFPPTWTTEPDMWKKPHYDCRQCCHLCVAQSSPHETKQLLQMALHSHLALPAHLPALQVVGCMPVSHIFPGDEKMFSCCSVQHYLIKPLSKITTCGKQSFREGEKCATKTAKNWRKVLCC